MILAGLPSAIAWRLAVALKPIARDWLSHITYCHPRHGLIGTCQPRGGRCATCNRERP